MSSDLLQPRALRNAFGNFGTGVALIGVHDAHAAAVGLTINSLASVSLEPALLSWCLAKDSQLFDAITRADRFSVNILAADQTELSNRMAMPGDHRFDASEWEASASGGIFVNGALAKFDCRLHQTVEAGDHVVFLGAIEEAWACEQSRAPLMYFRGDYRQLLGDD